MIQSTFSVSYQFAHGFTASVSAKDPPRAIIVCCEESVKKIPVDFQKPAFVMALAIASVFSDHLIVECFNAVKKLSSVLVKRFLSVLNSPLSACLVCSAFELSLSRLMSMS